MDLIDRKRLDETFTTLRFDEKGNLAHWGDRKDWCLHGHEIEKLIASQPTIPAVPLEPLCEWLAGYALPPKYAREAAEAGLSPEGLTRAWKYAIENMMECGLMEEGKHDHG